MNAVFYWFLNTAIMNIFTSTMDDLHVKGAVVELNCVLYDALVSFRKANKLNVSAQHQTADRSS